MQRQAARSGHSLRLTRVSTGAEPKARAQSGSFQHNVPESDSMHGDELEEGGWSSGFDESDDDDIIGGPL